MSVKKQLKTKKNLRDFVGPLVFFSFVVPIFYLIYKIIYIKVTNDFTVDRSIADYVLMLVQCLLGIIAIIVPKWITRTAKICFGGWIGR